MGDFEFQTSAKSTLNLGYRIYGTDSDSTYRVVRFVPHTGPLATFDFTGYGLEPLWNESWGIDNLTVEPINRYQVFVPSISLGTGEFHLIE